MSRLSNVVELNNSIDLNNCLDLNNQRQLNPDEIEAIILELLKASNTSATGGTCWCYNFDAVLADGTVLKDIPAGYPRITGGRWVDAVAGGAALGSELITPFNEWVITGDDGGANQVIDNGDGTYRLISDGSIVFFSISVPDQVGKTIQYTINTINTLGAISVADPDGQGDHIIGDGETTNIYIADDNSIIIKRSAAATDVTFSLTFKEVIPHWSSQDADGVNLDTVLLVDDAGTNKCTCVKANPTDTTNISKLGDAAATLTVIDDSEELALAGLDDVCNGNVYKLDNSAGSANAFAEVQGSSGNTNKHSLSVYARKTGASTTTLAWNDGTASVAFASSSFEHILSEDATPATTTRKLDLIAGAGAVIYFILPQLEENSVATSVIIGADTAASATRDADINTVQTPTVLTAESGAIRMRITPTAEDQITKYFWASVLDNDNLFGAYATATQVIGLHKIDAVNEFAVALCTVQVDVDIYVDVYWEADGTFGIRGFNVGDVEPAFSINSDHNTFPLHSTLAIGNKSDVGQFVGEYANNGQPICYASKEAAGW